MAKPKTNDGAEISVHPAADLFPMLSDTELADLAKDIKEHGLVHPVVMFKGVLLDGRNRLAACKIAEVEPTFIEYDGDDPIAFVVSVNILRRQLNPSQRGGVGVEIEALRAIEAKERQRLSKGRGVKGVVNLPQVNTGKARDQAAAMVGVSGAMIQRAKTIKKADPKAFKQIMAGKVTINKVYSKMRKDAKKALREKAIKDIEAASGCKFDERCLKGDVWSLGRHVLYCGDTSSQDFISIINEHSKGKAALAFADPPYGAKVKGFDDSKFYWDHEYLAEVSDVVVVTPGIVSIFEFARKTNMPYKWSLATWVTNGMTRGAVGFGNWIYSAVFSSGSVFRQSQDFHKITITNSDSDDTEHPTRKPLEFVQWIVDTFSGIGQLVIDPFLGSGQTLMVCEASERRCIGGEIDTRFCSEIIARWESISGEDAVKI